MAASRQILCNGVLFTDSEWIVDDSESGPKPVFPVDQSREVPVTSTGRETGPDVEAAVGPAEVFGLAWSAIIVASASRLHTARSGGKPEVTLRCS